MINENNSLPENISTTSSTIKEKYTKTRINNIKKQIELGYNISKANQTFYNKHKDTMPEPEETPPNQIEPRALGEQMDEAIRRKQKSSPEIYRTESTLTEEAIRERAKYKQKMKQILNHPLPSNPISESKFVPKEDLDEKSNAVVNFINGIKS
jgi:hypothetical protein